MRSKIVILSLLTTSFFSGVQLYAQENGGNNPPAPSFGPTPPPPPDGMIPIDDNLYLLVLAGITLGVYYIYRNRKIKKKAA